MKTLVFLNKEPQSLEPYTKNSKIITLSLEAELFLKKQNIPFTPLLHYTTEIDFDLITKETFSWMEKWPYKKINKKSFIELTAYNGIYLWWFIRQPMFYIIEEIIRCSKIITEIIEKEKPSKIVLFTTNSYFDKVLQQISKNKKIPLKAIETKKEKSRTDVSYYLLTFLRSLQGYFRYKGFDRKKHGILVTSDASDWQLSKDIKTGKTTKQDVQIGLVTEMLRKQSNLLAIDIAKNKKAAYITYKEKRKYVPYDYFLLRSFFDRGINKKLKNFKAELKKNWEFLKNSKAFDTSLKYNNLFLFEILKPQFNAYFNGKKGSFLSAARNIEIANKIFKENNFKACLLADENATSRHFTTAANLNNIHSVGIEHGYLGDAAPSYFYGKNETFPVPDKTAVFGDYFRDFLTKKSSYPIDKVVVTGQPRSDFIANKHIYNKKSLYKKLSLGMDKKLGIYITDTAFGLLSLVQAKDIAMVYNAVKGIKNLRLVHKLHPGEDFKQALPIKNQTNPNVILTKSIDLYELIHGCDFLVTTYSSVACEALLFGKPPIILNSIKFDPMHYIRENIGVGVKNQERLKKAMLQILENKPVQRKNRNFLYTRYYKIDGGASKRVLELIR